LGDASAADWSFLATRWRSGAGALGDSRSGGRRANVDSCAESRATAHLSWLTAAASVFLLALTTASSAASCRVADVAARVPRGCAVAAAGDRRSHPLARGGVVVDATGASVFFSSAPGFLVHSLSA